MPSGTDEFRGEVVMEQDWATIPVAGPLTAPVLGSRAEVISVVADEPDLVFRILLRRFQHECQINVSR